MLEEENIFGKVVYGALKFLGAMFCLAGETEDSLDNDSPW